MASIRVKWKKGNPYYYVVTSKRTGPNKQPREVILEYIGSEEKMKEIALKDYENRQNSSQNDSITQSQSVTFKSYEHGSVFAVMRMAERLGIETILEKNFTQRTIKGLSRARLLLFQILQRAINPGSMSDFAQWSRRTSLPYYYEFKPEDLSAQALWESMDGISQDEMDQAQADLVGQLKKLFPEELKELHLDYTNYYTFIDTRNNRCTLCHRGHNKQKRDDLRQFSLAMLTSSVLQVPLSWHLYNGNVNDKVEFADFVAHIRTSLPLIHEKTDDITITFDGGSNSEENFKNLPFHIICAHTLSGNKDLYDVGLEKYNKIVIESDDEDEHGERIRQAYRIDNFEFSGITGTGILTFSQKLYDGQAAQMDRDITKFQKEFKELQERLENPSSRLYSTLKKAESEYQHKKEDIEKYNGDVRKHNDDIKNGLKKGRKRKEKAVPEWKSADTMLDIVKKNCSFGPSSYLSEFIEIQVKEKGTRFSASYHIDNQEKEAYKSKYYGKKLTCTDHKDWSTERILSVYAKQECVENLFRTSKNTDHFSVRPQFHWTDDKIRVHVFLCLCSITIVEALRKTVNEKGINLSKPALLEQLALVRDGWIYLSDKKANRTLERIDDEDLEHLWNTIQDIPKSPPT